MYEVKNDSKNAVAFGIFDYQTGKAANLLQQRTCDYGAALSLNGAFPSIRSSLCSN